MQLMTIASHHLIMETHNRNSNRNLQCIDEFLKMKSLIVFHCTNNICHSSNSNYTLLTMSSEFFDKKLFSMGTETLLLSTI